MNNRYSRRILLFALYFSCFPLVSYGEESKLCTTLKSIMENSSEQYKKYRGAQINGDPEAPMWVGKATFGAINDCTVFLFVSEKHSLYECMSGKYDSDSQKIHLLWATMAKLTNECLISGNGNWVVRENKQDGKKKSTHSFEFAEINSNRSIIVKLVEKKRNDEPSMWKTSIVISRGQ